MHNPTLNSSLPVIMLIELHVRTLTSSPLRLSCTSVH